MSGRNRIDPHWGEIEPLTPRTLLPGLSTEKSGKILRVGIFRVGIFLDFVWRTTRTPHGAYVRGARRNRIDPHGGGIERLTTRTCRQYRPTCSRPGPSYCCNCVTVIAHGGGTQREHTAVHGRRDGIVLAVLTVRAPAQPRQQRHWPPNKHVRRDLRAHVSQQQQQSTVAQHSTAQHSTAQHSTAQHSTSTAQRSASTTLASPGVARAAGTYVGSCGYTQYSSSPNDASAMHPTVLQFFSTPLTP